MVGADFSSASQVATPPWREHAPWRVLAVEYVPSLHLAVAFSGAPLADFVGALPEEVLGAARAGAFSGAGAVLAIGAEVALGAGFSSANHVATPPCCEQAPRFVCAFVYEPSLHWPVDPFGGVWAHTDTPNASTTAIEAAVRSGRIVRMVILQAALSHTRAIARRWSDLEQ